VPAGKKAGGPCFQTALSEGDKRTLALAFFLAKLFGDAQRAEKVVVLDDLFTSLDKHRRSMTVDAIAAMAGVVEQILVLGHDAHFLRDVSMRLAKKAICKQVLLQAVREADGYSVLEACDLDDVCASDYFKRYKALQDFLVGTPSESALAVAQGMRTLFEGHLHRRFPGHVKEGVTVGVVLDQIKNAPAGSPLVVLQPCLAALHELNDFAGMFHHDTSGLAPRAEVTDHELTTYGARTMQLLHVGHL
jgi:wobble nucleotide-excising tRNase